MIRWPLRPEPPPGRRQALRAPPRQTVKPPFTVQQFLDVFKDYNLAFWPAQVVAYTVGLAAVILAIRPLRRSDRIVSGVLAGFWLWMGLAYHLAFFSRINRAAYGFAALFVIQGLLLALAGLARGRLSFRFRPTVASGAGAAFILYAMVIYPLLGRLAGHQYPRSPAFGLAPCPTTIFTFGMLLWAARPVPRHLLVIPLLWSLVGASAAVYLTIYEDTGLPLAGLGGTALILLRGRKTPPPGLEGSVHELA